MAGKASWRRRQSLKSLDCVLWHSREEEGGRGSGAWIPAQRNPFGSSWLSPSGAGRCQGPQQDLEQRNLQGRVPSPPPSWPPHLQHVSRDVLLTAVTADPKLGVIVGLAVGQPIPATEPAVRTGGGTLRTPKARQSSPRRGAVSKGQTPTASYSR